MEKSLWEKFVHFVKRSFQEKFKAFMPGCIMGFIGGQHLLFSGFVISVVEYAEKFTGTIVMAFGSGLATSYASFLVDNHKKKRNEKRPKKGQNDKAA